MISSHEKTSLLSWAPRFGTYSKVGNSSSQILSGILKIKDYEPIHFDASSPCWQFGEDESPFNEPGWRLYYHSLTWLIDILLESKQESFADDEINREDFVVNIVKSWAADSLPRDPSKSERWHGHCTSLRGAFLLTLSAYYEGEWLEELIKAHGEALLNEFSGYWNHGLVESVILYSIGHRFRQNQFINVGLERIRHCIEKIIDEQGAINEQAPTYAGYIWRLMRDAQIAIRTPPTEDESISHLISSKKKDLEDFITHSLTPAHRHVSLGDSYPDFPGPHPGSSTDWFVRPKFGGTNPGDTTKVYDKAGYIFSRASWEDDNPDPVNTYVTARFGPGRIIHGHNDHLSLTLWAYGRDFLVDSGHIGYKSDPMRRYIQSHQAHNVPLIGGRKFNGSIETNLVSFEKIHESRRLFFQMQDAGYQDTLRDRSTCLFHNGAMIVCDRVRNDLNSDPITCTPIWHISPEFKLDESDAEYVRFVSTRGDVALNMLHWDMSRDKIYNFTGFSYLKGRTDPLQGWVASGPRSYIPNPTVGFPVRSQSPRILTAIIPSLTDEKISWSIKSTNSGYNILRIHCGGRYYPVNIPDNFNSFEAPGIMFR